MPEDVEGPLRLTPAVSLPPGELRWRFSRSSGPGGQGVNTADSRVELSVDVAGSPTLAGALGVAAHARLAERLADRLVAGVLTVTSSEQRQQLRNREAARGRMALLLAQALAPPPPPRRPTRATAGSKRRRAAAKQLRSQTKSLRRRPGPRD